LLKNVKFSDIGMTLTAYRELLDDLRMGTAIGRRSRYMCEMFRFLMLHAQLFPV
jgi:hypothetical protein